MYYRVGMRRLPDGTVFYTLDEAEKVEFETFDIYLHELVLMYFGLDPDEPVNGDGVQKGVYVLYEELKRRGYKVQDPHYVFITRKPYSSVIERVLDNLVWSGYSDVDENDKLILSKKGKREVETLTGKKLKESDLEDLTRFREILKTLC
jgi:hypothetical protein